MSADAIFLQPEGGGLTVLTQHSYTSEDLLQRVLADYPQVLAGPTTDGNGEARLVLVRREAGIPGLAGGVNVFSLDHLFLDSNGVPVLVEVKRSSDTRIRREVVGQMLDYAANGVKYWPLEVMQHSMEATAAAAGRTAEELLAELSPGLDVEEFWRTVESNLRAGRIRMIFVADELPVALVRIIEFLNEQMTPAEVLGVELRQYLSSTHTVYVPRVVGRTSNAVAQKAVSGGGHVWDRDSFFEAAESRCAPADVSLMRRIFQHLEERGGVPSWGRGVNPSVSGRYPHDVGSISAWSLHTNADKESARAYLYFNFNDMVPHVATHRFEAAATILGAIPELAQKLQLARESSWRRYPSLYLDDATGDQARVDAVIESLDALIATD